MDLRRRIDSMGDAALGWAGAALLGCGAILASLEDPAWGALAALLGCLGGLACGVGAGRAFARRALLPAGPTRETPPAPTVHAPVPAAETGSLDMDALAAALAGTPEPVVALAGLVRDVRLRQGSADGVFGGGTAPLPCTLELFLAAELEDADIFSLGDAPVRARVAPRTGCLRLSFAEPPTDPAAPLRLRRVETAFNRTLFCDRRLGCSPAGGTDACYRFSASVEASVAAQAPWRRDGDVTGASGEWDVRRAVSEGLEEFQLPYRLDARWRVNAGAGVVGFSLAAQPADAMARHVWVEGLGRVVKATGTMRRRAAAELACREALLLAFHVFDRCDGVGRVWVRVDRGPSCVLSAQMTRASVADLDPTALGDPVEAMRLAGGSVSWNGDGLDPVAPGFSLDDEALCPRWRTEEPEGSDRALPEQARQALGSPTLAGLSRDAAARRRALAERIAAGLGGSCESSVSFLMGALDGIDDPEVREAVRGLVDVLLEGTVDGCDPMALAVGVTRVDAVRDAMARAAAHIHGGDGAAALSEVQEALARTEAWVPEGARCFSNYVERSLYNRLEGADGAQAPLVPASRLAAHLLTSSLLAATGDGDGATAHAFAARDLDPFDPSAHLALVARYEALGDIPMAISSCCDLLERAYDPTGAAVAYYRLAFLSWQEGDLELADACYRRSIALNTPCALIASIELSALEAQEGVAPVPEGEQGRVLASRGVPDAPTEAVRSAVREAARAAVEAGVFPVARELATAAALLDGDEVLLGLRESLEQPHGD